MRLIVFSLLFCLTSVCFLACESGEAASNTPDVPVGLMANANQEPPSDSIVRWEGTLLGTILEFQFELYGDPDVHRVYQFLVVPTEGTSGELMQQTMFFSGWNPQVDSCQVSPVPQPVSEGDTLVYRVPVTTNCNLQGVGSDSQFNISGLVVLLDDVTADGLPSAQFSQYNYVLVYAGDSSTIEGAELEAGLLLP